MTEASDQSQSNPRGQRSTAGCLGAVLIHPVALALAFAYGFIFGTTPMAHGPAPASGFRGGQMAFGHLLFFYVFSFGILPLAISGFGLWFGHWLHELFGGRHPVDQISASAQPSLGWRTAVWASGTYLAAYAAYVVLYWFLRFTGYQLGQTTMQGLMLVYLSLYAAIWGCGAVIAYLRHRSLQLSLWLIVIPFLIRLILPWIHLPPYSLHAVAVCILGYAIVTKRLMPPEKQAQNPTANQESAAPGVRG